MVNRIGTKEKIHQPLQSDDSSIDSKRRGEYIDNRVWPRTEDGGRQMTDGGVGVIRGVKGTNRTK